MSFAFTSAGNFCRPHLAQAGFASIRPTASNAYEAVRQFLKRKLAEVMVKIRELQQLETELKNDLKKCDCALKQQRGKECACPVLEGEERTTHA